MPSDQFHRVEKLVGECEDWIAPTLLNSWANTGTSPAGYYKDQFNVVHLRGNIDTGASGTVAFTLPEAYWPPYQTNHVTYNDNGGPGPGGAAVSVQVQTDGDVVCTYGAGTDIWLDGVTWRI